MSVVSGELRRIAAGAARGMGGGSVKSRWMLATNDTIEEIEAPGYFDAQADQLVVGDQIDVSANLSVEPEMRSYVVAGKTGTQVEVRPNARTRRFSTRAAAMAAKIMASVQTITLSGYHTEGDRGAGAIYRSVPDSGTLRPWQFRSNNDTRRWELVAPIANQWLFGAQGWNGSFSGFAAAPDDQPAFQAMADYCADVGAVFHATAGYHRINSPIIARNGPVADPDFQFLERGPTWTFDNACILRAGAAMSAIFQAGNSTYANMVRDGVITGGMFDQNNLATAGIWVPALLKCSVRLAQCLDIPVNGCGILGGTTIESEFEGVVITSSALICVECKIEGRKLNQSGEVEPPRAGSIGIRYVNCTDNQTLFNEVRGVKFGVYADFTSGWNGKHVGNHFWNLPTNDQVNDPMTAAFWLWGDNYFAGNQHDGPFLYCVVVHAPRNTCVGMGVNYGGLNSDTDNTAALFRLENDTTNGTVGGISYDLCNAIGNPSKRIANEVSRAAGVPVSALRKGSNNRLSGVVTTAPTNSGIAASCRATMTGSTGAADLGSDAQNITSATFGTAGALNVQFTRDVGTNTPIVVTVGMNPNWEPLFVAEDYGQRTARQAVFFFQNAAGAFRTPSGFNLLAGAGGAL